MYHTPIYLNVAYLSIRLLSWIALWMTACFLTCMHRQGRNKGWQLHRYIVLVLSSTLVQEFLLWLLGIAREHHASAFSHIYLVLVFFSDLTEALFLMLILMVAAGFCITSDSFRQHASKVLCIPPTYFVTCLVVDYTLYAIMEQPKYWTEDGEQVDFSKLVNVLALVLAWVYVIDITNTERAALRRALVPRAGAGGGAAAIGAAGGYGEDKQEPGDLLPSGVPRSDEEQLGGGQEPGFADAAHACEDEEAQVEEELGNVQDLLVRQRKLLLLDRFAYAVVAYWLLTALVLLVPVWNEAATVNRLIACLQALVYWLFMAALTFIFRPVKDNPYLMLGSDGGDDGELREAAATAIEFDAAATAHTASGEVRERPLGEPHMRRFSLGEDSEEGV